MQNQQVGPRLFRSVDARTAQRATILVTAAPRRDVRHSVRSGSRRNVDIAGVERALARLHKAVDQQRTPGHCLRYWSAFVRTRDGHRCVVCNRAEHVAAHHIVRKSFLPVARFQTGNGITLCSPCHSEPHLGFNRRPDLGKPMDGEGGEKIELMMNLFRLLAQDAATRGLRRDDFYYLSDWVLDAFKRFQTIPTEARFPGTRIEQAYLIWRQIPRCMLTALLQVNGLATPEDFMLGAPGIYLWLDTHEQ